MADERSGMMERGKARGEVRQRRRKRGRKGKQVELLMLVIMFLPGQSISKACYDIKHHDLSKTTYFQESAEWGVCVCVCVSLGWNRADRGSLDWHYVHCLGIRPLLYAMSWVKHNMTPPHRLCFVFFLC